MNPSDVVGMSTEGETYLLVLGGKLYRSSRPRRSDARAEFKRKVGGPLPPHAMILPVDGNARHRRKRYFVI